jgi:uncharacterized membrane protein
MWRGDPRRLIFFLGVITIALSIYIHDPRFLGEYTDYVAIYMRDPLKILTGYPYTDYSFEYTPLIAIQWMAVTRIALLLSAYGYDPMLSILRTTYVINTIFYIIYILAIYAIYRRIEASKISLSLAIASPSMIYYLFYNWDISASTLMVLGSLLFLRGRILTSSSLLGLAASTKIFPGMVLLSLTIIIARKDYRKALKFLTTGLFVASAPYLALSILSPPALIYILSYHSSWYCENCFYVLFTDDIFDPMLRSISVPLMIIIPLFFIIYILRYSSPLEHTRYMVPPLIATSLSISLSYVYSPQMNIMISPLYLVLRDKALYILIIQDILNTLIMVLWFHEDLITEALGIESRGPWYRESPIQWIAFARIILIWVIGLLITREERKIYTLRAQS